MNYIRDKEGREVDFSITIDGKFEYLIEVKLSNETISNSLVYYANQLRPKKAIQVVANLNKSYTSNNVHVMTIFDFLKIL